MLIKLWLAGCTNGFTGSDGKRQCSTASGTSAIAGPDSGTVNTARARVRAAASAVWSAPYPSTTWSPGEGPAWYCGTSHHVVTSGHAAGYAACLGITTVVAASPW